MSTDLGPQVGVVNDVIRYANSSTVRTDANQAGGITQVSLVRLGSATHNFDQDQRFMFVAHTQKGADELSVTAPATPQEAPPGYYMLFLLDDGVPSVSKIVNLCGFSSVDCNANATPDDCDLAAGVAEDCNGNTIPDLCDISAGTSQNCNPNSNLIPDECEEGGPFPAQLVASTPAHDESLWRSQKNIARLTFACDVQAPGLGQVLIQELLDGGQFGSDLSGSFSFTVENPGAGNRVLRINETTAVLTHRKWYTIRNTGSWSGVDAFELHYVVQVGDATNDGLVTGVDWSLVNAAIITMGVPDDDRRDINGDGNILGIDASIVSGHIISPPVPKPGGH